MGPLNTNYQPEPSAAISSEIYHFTHHHPLQLSHNHNLQTQCSACTHLISNRAYSCQNCNYNLHILCSKMPQQIQHPIDTNKTHVFKLFPKPVYPEGKFNCNACGNQGSGFSYHCKDCLIDLHVLCSALPPLIYISSHPHQLTRVFASPYADNKFICDVCKMPGSKTWLYHCGTCQYDVHLGCITGTQQIKTVGRSMSYPPPYVHLNVYQQQQPVLGRAVSYQGQYYNNPVVRRPGGSHGFMSSIIGGGLEGMSSAVVQNFANMFIGGFAGGDGFLDGGVFDAFGGMEWSF